MTQPPIPGSKDRKIKRWAASIKTRLLQNKRVLLLKAFWQRYTAGFKTSMLWAWLAVAALFYIFREPIFSLTTTLLVEPLLSKCPKNDRLVDMIILGFSILAGIRLVRRLGRSLLPTPGSVVSGIAVLFIYFGYCRHSNSFFYYTFHIPLLSNIAYLDVS